jgi:hypothetical protein
MAICEIDCYQNNDLDLVTQVAIGILLELRSGEAASMPRPQFASIPAGYGIHANPPAAVRAAVPRLAALATDPRPEAPDRRIRRPRIPRPAARLLTTSTSSKRSSAAASGPWLTWAAPPGPRRRPTPRGVGHFYALSSTRGMCHLLRVGAPERAPRGGCCSQLGGDRRQVPTPRCQS